MSLIRYQHAGGWLCRVQRVFGSEQFLSKITGLPRGKTDGRNHSDDVRVLWGWSRTTFRATRVKTVDFGSREAQVPQRVKFSSLRREACILERHRRKV